MTSLVADILPVLLLTAVVVANLVFVNIQDISVVTEVSGVLPEEAICVDLESGILINFIRENVNFEDAKQLCRDASSELARIGTRGLSDEIEPFLEEDSRFPVWIGKPFMQ